MDILVPAKGLLAPEGPFRFSLWRNGAEVDAKVVAPDDEGAGFSCQFSGVQPGAYVVQAAVQGHDGEAQEPIIKVDLSVTDVRTVSVGVDVGQGGQQ